MFLEHCYRWVTSEGVLVFVVPASAVGTCARLLTSQGWNRNVSSTGWENTKEPGVSCASEPSWPSSPDILIILTTDSASGT